MNFFEGPEKKYEIIMHENASSLRDLGASFWQKNVELACAQVITAISNNVCDAYLLSESSLFVYDDRAIMITCGETTLAKSLVYILKNVDKNDIAMVFYERKNHHFPERQKYQFDEDCKYISEHIPVNVFCFGDAKDNHVHLLHMDKPYSAPQQDVTLEILMHGIGENAAKFFEKKYDSNRSSFYEKTGIDKIFQGFKVDDFFFDPQGYSLNAIKDDDYYTIHVTPQKTGAYVSFETNASLKTQDEITEVAKKVLDIFRPETFDVVFFCNGEACAVPHIDNIHYKNLQDSIETFCGYTVTFQTYTKKR